MTLCVCDLLVVVLLLSPIYMCLCSSMQRFSLPPLPSLFSLMCARRLYACARSKVPSMAASFTSIYTVTAMGKRPSSAQKVPPYSVLGSMRFGFEDGHWIFFLAMVKVACCRLLRTSRAVDHNKHLLMRLLFCTCVYRMLVCCV